MENVLYPLIMRERILPSVKRDVQDLLEDVKQGKKLKINLKQRAKETLKCTLNGRSRRKKIASKKRT